MVDGVLVVASCGSVIMAEQFRGVSWFLSNHEYNISLKKTQSFHFHELDSQNSTPTKH